MDGSLLSSVFILLAAACLLVPLSKLSGLGSVIGYLVAGVIIGPSALGMISEPETILHFSEFGVVMMLFLIGLEVQPKQLWTMRGRLVGLGGLQVGLTSLCVTLGAIYLGRPLGEAVVIGMALSLSSTAVALQIMQDRNILRTKAGESGFSVLLFQDVIVIAMIAALPLIAAWSGAGLDAGLGTVGANDGHGGTGSGLHGPSLAGAVIAVFGIMIVGGRLLLKPVFRLIAKSQVREIFTVIALLLVIGATLMMNWLGLSPALGAFIAGVVLADSDYRHQLERDIEPFKALLLGLFFMSVGMSLDFAALSQNPFGILAMVFALVLLKFAVLFIVGKIFKLELSSNLLYAGLLSQAGEFGFVLFQFAKMQGLIAPGSITVLTAVVALSMATTPFLLIAYDKLVLPRLRQQVTTGEPPVNCEHRVLILGFGRVGQIANRLLHTQDIETTILDHDGDHIEFVKQFGERVFYGDAADVDLLHAAGAAQADVILIAIDDVTKATEAAHDIKKHFPNAKIIARARNRTHMFDLMAEGVDYVERETVRGALALGRATLINLGFEETLARRLSDNFLKFDSQLIEETWEHRNDMDELVKKAADGRDFIKRTLNADRDRREEEIPVLDTSLPTALNLKDGNSSGPTEER